MDSKVPSTFWQSNALATPELLLAALWLRTQSQLNLAGYGRISLRHFTCETCLPPEALDRVTEALGEGFIRHGDEYWIRDFIADEFGRGASLLHNNMSGAIVKALSEVRSPWVALAVMQEYPELSPRWEKYTHQALGKPLPSRTQVQRAREGVREGVREGEGEGEGRGAGEGAEPPPPSTPPAAADYRPPTPRPPRPTSTTPAEHPEPMRTRMLALGEIMRRRDTTPWNEPEKRALRLAGLLDLSAEDFAEQTTTMRRFYRAQIPPAMERQFWRRTTLPILLNNWPSELDKARSWARHTSGETTGTHIE